MKKKAVKIICIALAAVIALSAAGVGIWAMNKKPKNVNLVISDGESERVSVNNFEFNFNKTNGEFSVLKNGKALFANAKSEYKLGDEIITSADYDEYKITSAGDGVTVLMTKSGAPSLCQTFTFEQGKDYFLTKAQIISHDEISTNYIAPIVINGGNLGNDGGWSRFLEVPFDNDAWVKFTTKTLDESGVAYEVGAFFEPDDGAGLIIGSVEHDNWKTAITMDAKGGKVESLKAYCGAVVPRYGEEPHGELSGKSVSSAAIMVGSFDNWKNGMNEFCDVNLSYQPKRKSVTDAVPIGWNSWGSVQQSLNYDIAIGTSDYVKENLQDAWQEDGSPVYINLDSYWDNLSDEELKKFAEHCKQNGQTPGIYIAPFIIWGDDDWQKENYVPGTDNKVTYYDLRLKKHDGTLYGKELDGCYPMDVTHPAVKNHAQAIVDRFKAAGFEYIKLDYLVHAALEGDYYDSSFTTGIQTYNYAMGFFADMLGEDMFISVAMCPTFPYQYANGRRFGCDSYYKINETEYTLNSVTYGFWEQRLYDYTDPDHLVVWGKDGGATENEAIARITSGVISGTTFLAGDNFVSPAGNAAKANERYLKTLANKDVMDAARLGEVFIPVIDKDCPEAANIFMLEKDGALYIAVFNYSSVAKKYTAELPSGKYAAKELWSGEESAAEGELSSMVSAKSAKLYKLIKE